MRIFLLSMLLLASGYMLNAEPVNEKEAAVVALNYYSLVAEKTGQVEISSVDYIIRNNDTLIYLFYFGSEGFIFISAEDAAYPVLGYGDKATAWQEAHSSVKGWMERNLREISHIRKNNLDASSEIRDMWRSLKDNSYKASKSTAEPLLSCTWNQDWPYNAMAPADQFGPGGHAYAGCVAVSMAQLMYYYRYPLSGLGNHDYYHYKYGILTADFSAANYEYSKMTDDPSGKENDEIAELIYHCGVAVEMGFGANGSGASMYQAATALTSYFNYADSAFVGLKDDFTDNQWKNMIRNEIDHNRPLMYAGFPQNGSGHAFNLDGYQGADHFHFNWGWSGSFDGYYYISALSPGSQDFSYGQLAIFHMVPANAYPQHCSSPRLLSALSGSFEDGSGHYPYQNNADCSWLIKPTTPVDHIQLEFSRIQLQNGGDSIRVYDGSDSTAPLIAAFSGDTAVGTIYSTGSQLFITFSSDSSIREKGFHANYKAILPVFCNSMTVLSDESGTISDGSGAYPYNNNTFCKWFINPQGAGSIEAEVVMLDTYNSDDFLAFYDPSGSPGTLLGKFHGNLQNFKVHSPTGQMLVVFSTNSDNTADGFELNYTSSAVKVEEFNKDDVLIMPNPSDGSFVIEVPSYMDYQSIQLLNPEGQFIRNLPANRPLQLSLNPGLYLVRIHAKQTMIIRKLIISANER